MTTGGTPRSVRNNNPLDIDRGPRWLGLMPQEMMTAEQAGETRFAVFRTPEYGFRAGVILLRDYSRLYGINTVTKITARLAPPEENLTTSYIQAVCHWTGFSADDPLDMENREVLRKLAKAYATQEAGGWEPYWQDCQLEAGLVMAGLSAPSVPVLGPESQS